MNLKFENIFLFIAVLADFTRTAYITFGKCPRLVLVNGRPRYGWQGRSVRFNCMRRYQLVGVKYATCMNGKWDADVPICVKNGCSAPSTTHVNGQFIESYRGAVVRIVCNAGYTLVGSPSVYCNGVRWNETFPVCRVKNSNPALSCDFETSDLCGWSQDPMHDFDWKRENGTTPLGEVKVGPPFDHTKGVNATGHYILMESSSARMENETARLYSPVYPSNYSNNTCFRFWYYVHGAVTGFLKVFVKPEGVELYNLIPAFWISGEQGDSWKESVFSIEYTDSPFQIVIEGVKSSGVVGDIAFDDVAITNECKILQEMTSSSTEFSTSVTPDEDYDDSSTCRNRCNEEKTSGMGRLIYDRCSCQESCVKEGTCCPDYFFLCTVFVSSPRTTTQTSMKMSSSISSSPATDPSVVPKEKISSISSTTSSPKPSTKATPKLLPPVHSNNEIPKKPFGGVPPQNSTPTETPRQKYPTTPSSKGNSTTPARNTTETKSSSGKMPEKKAENLGGKAQTGNETVAKGVPRVEMGPNVENIPKVTRTTVTVPALTTTAKAAKSSKQIIRKTFLENPSSPNLGNELRFIKKPKEAAGKETPPEAIKVDKNEEKTGGLLREIVEFGSAAIAIIIVIIFGVLWYRRSQHRKTEREFMVEDSDVRFLTSDEALDFTLARPADDDL